MEDGTLDDRRRDGGTNSTLRTKEEGTHLTLNEHDDDDEQNPEILVFLSNLLIMIMIMERKIKLFSCIT